MGSALTSIENTSYLIESKPVFDSQFILNLRSSNMFTCLIVFLHLLALWPVLTLGKNFLLLQISCVLFISVQTLLYFVFLSKKATKLIQLNTSEWLVYYPSKCKLGAQEKAKRMTLQQGQILFMGMVQLKFVVNQPKSGVWFSCFYKHFPVIIFSDQLPKQTFRRLCAYINYFTSNISS